MIRLNFTFLMVILIGLLSCKKTNNTDVEPKDLTIFFVNDQHGQLENFAKIKHIVDKEKEETNVILACSGDIFSGNPVVDNYPEKGYPIIHIMNEVGFDISVLGNHEFDYGESILKDRMEQAEFKWVCANIDMGTTGIPEPAEYTTLTVGEFTISFLGLVETYGKPNAIIPATHPWRVQNLTFEKPEDVVAEYANIKEQEAADLYIALTHMGHFRSDGELADFRLANEFPYFDLIIGGHTNLLLDTMINNTPVFQAGNYLNYLGKIELNIQDQSVTSYEYELINLNSYPESDAYIQGLIADFNAEMSSLDEVIGHSELNHERWQIGCFYTDALAGELGVDVCLQNPGGVRTGLDEGDITKRELFEISPFNNGTVTYHMKVSELKDMFVGTGAGFYYSGMQVQQIDDAIEIRDANGNILDDNMVLTVGTNDYIPAVYDSWFPTDGSINPLTDAETTISFLENGDGQVAYPTCPNYFKFQ